MRLTPPSVHELPFLKRYAFGDEMEFRLFATQNNAKSPTLRVPVGIDAISRVMLSPWLPKNVAAHTKSTLKAIRGCSKLKIYRSTLIENEAWKKFARIDV